MSISKSLAVANSTVAAGGAGGFAMWANEYAPTLGLILTAVAIVISVLFYTLNLIETKRHNRSMEEKNDG